jgi:hypothetical protein
VENGQLRVIAKAPGDACETRYNVYADEQGTSRSSAFRKRSPETGPEPCPGLRLVTDTAYIIGNCNDKFSDVKIDFIARCC